MHLDPQLLLSTDATPAASGSFNATLNAYGLYSPFQFVLRLSPAVHQQLSRLPAGVISASELGFEGAQAFSTYLHETIHWWQHVGSTHGLMRSLSYPTQAHGNYKHLKELLARVGFKKPISKLPRTLPPPSGPGTLRGLANIIINNHFDFGAFRRLTHSVPTALSAVNDPLFDCVGHAFDITYGNNVLVLAATMDPEFRVFRHPKEWDERFNYLRESKEDGFYPGSRVSVWPIGAYEIFEGQACFGQLQYLAFAAGGQLGWEDLREIGVLHGVYVKAFENFLDLAELEWPPCIDHPIVALFLLICDLAINPGAGFPFPLRHFATFITDTDPGARFGMLSRIVRLKCPDAANAIRHYSRDEYQQVSEQLTEALIVESPLDIASVCTGWSDDGGPFAPLMAEYRTFNYRPVNLPIRFLFSHFLAFMRDKLTTPEFFCWPGAWMAGRRVSERSSVLFERHSAPFVDKQEDDGIFPRSYRERNDKVVQDTFDTFYAVNITYDMTDQWITKPGPFVYNYNWLSQSATPEAAKGFADRHFTQVYGVSPDMVELP